MYNPPGAKPEPPLLKCGDVLDGRFEIIQFLARGGMGEVYEAADRHMQGKRLAPKTLRPDGASDAVVRPRFEREALLAREVHHPNVCPTYDLFRIETSYGELLFLTMKLLRGEPLRRPLEPPGAVPAENALAIAVQMAAALHAAHQSGVIHRDFKPGNVMLESSAPIPHVYITDFGLSRVFEADGTLAQTERISGTLGYIAPELLQGRIAGPPATYMRSAWFCTRCSPERSRRTNRDKRSSCGPAA
jgi:serine/threonine protein kinase